MADPDFFPGFEGDDEPAKPAPAKPPAAAPAKPGFDPFAGAKVDVNAPAPAQAPAAAPAKGPSRAAAPAPAPAAEPDDAELKPGSRKDLWKCPHCGAGNKPDRGTCRSCGKEPADPVVQPWYRNNVIRAGLIAAVGAIVLLAVWMSRVDLSLREPGPAGIDLQRPRISGTAEGTIDVTGDIRFIGTKLISVSGRVVAVRQHLGMTWIALALGINARDDDAFKALAPRASAGGFDFDGGCVLACIFDEEPQLRPGAWLSLAGTTGDLVKEASLLSEAEGAFAVRVDEFRVQGE